MRAVELVVWVRKSITSLRRGAELGEFAADPHRYLDPKLYLSTETHNL